MTWISIKDRLPENNQIIVFIVENRIVPLAGNYLNGKFRESLDLWGFADELITHWMPLPELPNEMD